MGKRINSAEAEALALSALGSRMMNYKDIARMLGLGLRTVKRMTAEGTLPAPDLRLSRIVRWRPTTIQRWIDRQGPRNGGGQ